LQKKKEFGLKPTVAQYSKNVTENDVKEIFRNKEHIDFPDILSSVQKSTKEDIIGELRINLRKQVSSLIQRPDINDWQMTCMLMSNNFHSDAST
jgi:ABC-type oligopeptide transport system ATPase subunit